jgi:hypothetical protein
VWPPDRAGDDPDDLAEHRPDSGLDLWTEEMARFLFIWM